MPKGKFIVIEGSDGSGKSTHFNLLLEYLRQSGKEIATYKFPQYDKPSSYFSVQYLNGAYGGANALGAYKPSLFYALDRFDASESIRADLEAGKTVLCDRFVGSNMAHQGQKIDDAKEREAYFNWIYDLEFNILDVPQPDLNLVLVMPPKFAYDFMTKRDDRNYTTTKHDIHEADMAHLERAVATYGELCERFSDTFTAVKCTNEADELRTIDDIQAEIRKIIEE
jgi:dTMP kinase